MWNPGKEIDDGMGGEGWGGERRVVTRRLVRGELAMTLSQGTKKKPFQTEASLKALRETSSIRQNCWNI